MLRTRSDYITYEQYIKAQPVIAELRRYRRKDHISLKDAAEIQRTAIHGDIEEAYNMLKSAIERYYETSKEAVG